jgi:hypothetical protein
MKVITTAESLSKADSSLDTTLNPVSLRFGETVRRADSDTSVTAKRTR